MYHIRSADKYIYICDIYIYKAYNMLKRIVWYPSKY